ncbi:hypothetical protein [Pseudalkalibacillus sp. SCS-8]|uniref:hypothetical protein n=1 Tax=Pseudalkalibacillus nanhaiensis TaxID=3115291 RepID=UPI0032DAC96B
MKYRFIVLMFLTPMLILAVLPFLLWQLKDVEHKSIQVIDKTVPKNDYREHLGLFWLLDHRKAVKADGEYYRKETDYYGYDPESQSGETGLEIEKEVDLIYVADTYGIYTEDLRDKPTGERSKLIYGGLTIFDWNKIIEAKDEDVTLILEFNSIASPTDHTTRSIVEKEMGFQWSGWIGRHFKDLSSDEIPPWLIRNYESQYRDDWRFEGEGLTFVHESDRVVVLNEEDIRGRVLFKWLDPGVQHYPKATNSRYHYWFDIIEPDEDTLIEAEYEIDMVKSGRTKLEENGIPTHFPAVIRLPDERKYYFAGDFADIPVDYNSRWTLPDVFYGIYSFFHPDEEFFWKSYIPMMDQILEETNSSTDGSL